MKILVIGNEDRYRANLPEDIPATKHAELFFCERDASDETLLATCRDADYIAVDAITPLSGDVIRAMPNLRLIHSEGVGFNGIDLAAAKEKGVCVCNCKGVNAYAVAEQAVLLMLGTLRQAAAGDQAVLDGRQIQRKEQLMVEGIRELSDCAVGLVGFGDIARATAKLLQPFGCSLYYYARSRKSDAVEQEYRAVYLPLEELCRTCDIVSLHVPVTEETRGMADSGFFSRMKRDAVLINTSRGELVDNDALREALLNGTIGGAGLDTISPEPVQKDNPLVQLASSCREKLFFSPHIGGITTGSFRRAHRTLWQAFDDMEHGRTPKNIVNAG